MGRYLDMARCMRRFACLVLLVALLGADRIEGKEVEMMDESKVGPSDHEELVQMQGMAPAPPKPAKGAKPKKKDLPDPPAVLAPAPPTLLDQVLKKRRHQRLKMTAHNLRKKFMDAKVERQEADAILG